MELDQNSVKTEGTASVSDEALNYTPTPSQCV